MSQGLDIEAIKKEIREQILTELKTSKTGGLRESILAQSAEEKPVKPKRKLSEKQLAALKFDHK
ncbi:hypothetical protein TVAG_208480 [Trichomonas vaginalis G3]|uniref:Uncharacterized protein n=1 Tax=Trichomonas vaginalis (strain ATCC PRA-98 / G3) TaxID=412133 RepID=A2F348_TRIV3|nr:hypothetical protein TVAG_208480 [Trichomonas vaginalis G3]|eukprot:XP_001313585.1 hypothetical protein [Trichomonas vaginalis G3]